MANTHSLSTTIYYLHNYARSSNIFLVDHKNTIYRFSTKANSTYYNARVSSIFRSWGLRAATDFRFVEESTHRNNADNVRLSFIDIPVTCYQILGIHDKAEKDEIVKSVMHLKNAEIEEGYTKDAVISRHNILMDVRDKLLFEPEYAGFIKEKQPPKSSLKIPWDWLPAALCLLQEAGEDNLVLQIGRKALQHPDSKPFVHDMLLAMALAECAIAKVGFEKNNISQGFEALARAQCLLRSKISLGKMMLLSQIEESLEELAPACTLELLGIPRTPDNAERRLGAIAALRELLRQGLDIDSSCRVSDWSCFLNQAIKKLLASEIIDLIPWDDLAVTRKNRKSLESQNQRIVVDFNNFYMVLLAHIALGFSSKQSDLINKAKSICECLIASEGVDLKFEESFCSFLIGQAEEATVAGKLGQLEACSTSSQIPLQKKEITEFSSSNKPLERWLKEAVLDLFPDTRDSSPSLTDFFTSEKKITGKRRNTRIPLTISSDRGKTLTVSAPLGIRDGEPSSSTESSRYLGSAVNQLAPPYLRNPLIEGKTVGGSNGGQPSIQMKRTLGAKQGEVWSFGSSISQVLGKIVYVTTLGFILISLFKLKNLLYWRSGTGFGWRIDRHGINTILPTWPADSWGLSRESGVNKGKVNDRRFSKFLSLLKTHPGDHSEVVDLQTASLSSGLSHSLKSTHRQQMPFEDAEALVKQWQATKAEALGSSHDIHGLFEVLEGSMLIQWQGLSDAAKANSCFWKFVLLQLKIVRAEVVKDDTGKEIAEIEVYLEEAAELVDASRHSSRGFFARGNKTYYSPYKILYLLKRKDDGSWRFYEGGILTSSV